MFLTSLGQGGGKECLHEPCQLFLADWEVVPEEKAPFPLSPSFSLVTLSREITILHVEGDIATHSRWQNGKADAARTLGVVKQPGNLPCRLPMRADN